MQPKRNSPVCEHCGYDEGQCNLPHQLQPGTVLNNQYVIGRALGQGGFGITYIGWDQFLGIPVAIKEFYPSGIVTRDTTNSTSLFLYNDHAKDRFVASRDRFAREATSLARLGRSSGAANIVRVQNLVQANATAYIIMEYVDGIDLRRYMKRQGGVLTLEETLRLLLPMMESLEKVHESHIIHRDISPDNIMVMPDGNTKLIDFGAAHEVQQDEEGNQKSTEAILKYGFAPPEQYQRKGELGPWTDVYAMCATIYYCTTGKLPPNATDRVLGSEDFAWDQVPNISGTMAAILRKGTAIRKDDRIQSMRQLREALQKSRTIGDTDPGQQEDEVYGETPEKREESPRTGQPNRLAGTVALTQAPSEVPYTAPLNRQEPVIPPTVPVRREEKGAVTTYSPPQQVQKPKAPESKKYLLFIAAIAAVVAGILLLRPKPEPIPEEDPITAKASAAATEPSLPPDAWKNNILMHTYDGEEKQFVNEYADLTIYRSDIHPGQILTVTFLDTLAEEPLDSWDVSHGKNGSVKAWVRPNGKLYDLYIAAEGGINGREACHHMFINFTELEKISFTTAFHTDEAEDMSGMFAHCVNLASVHFEGFVTSNVKNMCGMFVNCKDLTTLDLSSFDTSRVENMIQMFLYCEKLITLDLSSFNTGNVKAMDAIFSNCDSLTDVNHAELNQVLRGAG